MAVTKDGCRIAWLAVPVVATAALAPPVAGRKPKSTLRRISIAVLVTFLFILVLNVIATIGVHGALSRSTPSTSMGGIMPIWGARDGQV
ncbi:hypothetical protein [Mycolicibacterium peregrinum]|uniref:hypothetical protein n=1 Tax=Mycolicibacterium peregrinum TaxID=43304 RepID=UPI001041CD7D|nr:hypothetical protein [Mycolicibacterium peregrinum]